MWMNMMRLVRGVGVEIEMRKGLRKNERNGM
jgi:hypothetical protein